jgi:hypothetical protein
MEQHWFYYVRCEKCKAVEMVAGPRRSDTPWKSFSDILLRSSEARPQFRYCKECDMLTYSTLIGFEKNEEITKH